MRIDNHTHVGFDPLFYLKGWSPYCLDLPRLFLETEGSGIDTFVVFPFISYMDLDLKKLQNNQIELAADDNAVPYRFENRRLCDDIRRCTPELQRRLRPFLIADPARRALEQIREWEKMPKDYRLYGIKIQGTIIQSPVLSLLSEGACILDYAEERDMAMLIHTSIIPDDQWSQCADVLKVVESRQNIRFVLGHSCRYHLPTLRRVAELPNVWFDCASHVIHCTCAARDMPAVAIPSQRFPADYNSPAKVLRDLAEAFPGKLIWGSDIPFYSCEYDRLRLSSSYRQEIACLNALPENTQDRICRRNTLAWLGGRE